MGSIRRLGDKRYRIVYDCPREDGKRKQKTETLVNVDKREAERIYGDRIKAVRESSRGSVECATMNALLDRFLQSRRTLGRAASTIQRYEGLMKTYLRPSFGSMRPSDVTTNHILSAYDTWVTHGTTGATRRHAHDLLRDVFNRAVSWDIVSSTPTAKISSDDVPKAKRPDCRVLNTSELKIVLHAAKNPSSRSRSRGYLGTYSSFHPAIAFLAYTGARRGEALAIRWADLDLDHAELCVGTISRSLAEVAGALHFKQRKNGRPLTVSISPNLAAILKEHRVTQAKEKALLGRAYADDDLVFCNPDGSPLKPWNFGAAFKALIHRCGVTRVRLHDLRHTHASLLAQEGIPIQDISARLGHSSIGVTVNRYISVYRGQDDKAALAFDRLLDEERP